MKKEEIQAWDWQRILLGNAPGEFMLEVFIRTIIIYLILLVVMRLLGKKMNANVSIFELTVVILLGAIVSVPMQIPERGLLQGIIILACVTALYRGISWLTFRYRRAELLTQGDVSLLVKDGVVDVAELGKSSLSHEQLYAQLRHKKIRHLGQVRRVYLEACGVFSIFQATSPKPGLSILPGVDEKLYNAEARNEDIYACKNCGYVVESHARKGSQPCSNCGANDWDHAINDHTENFHPTETAFSQ